MVPCEAAVEPRFLMSTLMTVRAERQPRGVPDPCGVLGVSLGHGHGARDVVGELVLIGTRPAAPVREESHGNAWR